MTQTLNSTRRNFLKGAAGLAALYGSGKVLSLNTILPGLQSVHAQGEFSSNRMSAVLPEVSTDINLVTPHLAKEIAPGLVYEVWAFNESGPGPFLHVREGETVHFRMENTSDMDHS
ncbi:MAG TPA: twin-arginine translocation signal domain-containing protein, partial [Aggregatilineales bacterium]|nr:twin-arginine translocation signal domain-containing protein [Aggregatilineales bacterium]